MANTIIHPDDRHRVKEIAAKYNVDEGLLLDDIEGMIESVGKYRFSYGGKAIRDACGLSETYINVNFTNLIPSFEMAREILDLRLDGDGDCHCGGSFIDHDVESFGHTHNQWVCDCCGKYQD